ILIIAQEVSGSKLPVGSSAINMLGSLEMARPIDTSCCSSPDNTLGKERSLFFNPTNSKTSIVRSRILLKYASITSRAKATFSYTVNFGSNLKSWNTTPTERLNIGTSFFLISIVFVPRIIISPWEGLVSRYINLTNVDLPAPLGPTTYTNSPGSMLILIPFNAVIPVWYVLYTSFMIIIYIFTFIIYSFVTSFSSRIFLDLVSFDYV